VTYFGGEAVSKAQPVGFDGWPALAASLTAWPAQIQPGQPSTALRCGRRQPGILPFQQGVVGGDGRQWSVLAGQQGCRSLRWEAVLIEGHHLGGAAMLGVGFAGLDRDQVWAVTNPPAMPRGGR
jgi:hypothetical protein